MTQPPAPPQCPNNNPSNQAQRQLDHGTVLQAITHLGGPAKATTQLNATRSENNHILHATVRSWNSTARLALPQGEYLAALNTLYQAASNRDPNAAARLQAMTQRD